MLASPDVQNALRVMAQAGRAAWPDLAVDEEAFMASVLARLEGVDDPEGMMREAHGPDLYLAYACATGCPRAHIAFERTHMVHVGRYVASVDGSAEFVDELAQVLRDKLFVGREGSPPKILDYSGRGPLGGWLRVAAVRTARNMKRAVSGALRSTDDEQAKLLAAPSADPELRYLKDHYGKELREALEGALRSLTPRAQAVLRLHYVEGMSSSAIAGLYGVSGAAVRAWVRDSRIAAFQETRKRLAETLRLAGAELGELMALVESRFELTLSRVLAAGKTPEGRG